MRLTRLIILSAVFFFCTAAQVIILERKKILDGKVEILLPKDFTPMSQETMKKKYSPDKLPTLVYTNTTDLVNVAFNYTPNKATQEQIEAFRLKIMETFTKLYPEAVWLSTGVKEVNERKVAYLEMITPGSDTRIYNLIFLTDLDGRLLMCNFNCTENDKANWVEPAKKIMSSLIVIQNKQEN